MGFLYFCGGLNLFLMWGGYQGFHSVIKQNLSVAALSDSSPCGLIAGGDEPHVMSEV